MNRIFFLIPLFLIASFGFQEVFATEIQIAFDNSLSGRINDFADGFCGELPADFRSTQFLFQKSAGAFPPYGTSCINAYGYFNLTSIPNNVIIYEVELITDINETFGGKNCDLGELPNLASSYTDDELFTATENNKNAILNDWTGCQNDATNATVSIPNAITPIQNSLTTDDFFILTGSRGDEGWDEQVIFTNLKLNVTYATPPDNPKLTGGVIDQWVGVDLGWFASDIELDQEAIDHYEIERYDGTTWNTYYSSSGINNTDTLPTASSTGEYRISGYGTNSGSNCSTHFMNQDLVESLVGYWTGCNNVKDSGLHDQDVSWTNGTESYIDMLDDTWFDFGESDGSGTNATVSNHFLPIYSQVQFNNTDVYSMGAWFITKNGTDNDRAQNFFSLGESGNALSKLRLKDDGAIDFTIRGSVGSKIITSPLTIYADNLPHLVVGTNSGNGDLSGMNLYIDGQWVVQGASDPFTESTVPVNYIGIGGHNPTLSNPLDGYGKDFMVFNKELTAHEIELLYNEQIDTLFPITEEITSLNATVIDLDTVRLDFATATTTGVLPLACYQINYTTPQGDPLTIATSCVSPSTSIAVNNLNTFDNEYSFRMGTNNLAIINVTSLIANTTSFELFTIGNITTPSGDNPTTVEIEFVEYDYTNRTDVQVRYDEFLDLECDIGFKFARTNSTYGNLTETVIGGGLVYTNFTFNDPDNEIITMQCNDVSDTTIEGTYLITQTTMPLLTQVQNFQGGLYGTDGQFGVLDLITLFVVIISMIGFNRYNPALGVIVMVMGMGAMSYFGFIQWSSTLMGVIALIVVLAVIQVRKQ